MDFCSLFASSRERSLTRTINRACFVLRIILVLIGVVISDGFFVSIAVPAGGSGLAHAADSTSTASSDEMDWQAGTAGRSRLIIGGDSNYPPYEYLDENGQPAGFNVDLTRAIAEDLGLPIEIQLGTWSEIRQQLKDNRIDLIQGMSYSPERDNDFDFTGEHSLVRHVIVSRLETPSAENLEQLAGKLIVVEEGDIMHDIAVQAGFEKQLLLAQSQEEALNYVSSDQADYALVAMIPALYWIEKLKIANLRLGNKTVMTAKYCYATTPAHHQLVALFSRGLDHIKASGEYEKIYQRWLGRYDYDGRSRGEILKYVLPAVIPLLLLFFLVALWSQLLRRRLETQESKLKESQTLLIQQEKLAAIGQLAAGVAHEINNPLGYISSNLGRLKTYGDRFASYFQELDGLITELPQESRKALEEKRKKYKIDQLIEDLPELVEESQEGSGRIKKIVEGLKCFSRSDSEEATPVDINECLENSITIVWNEIKYNANLEREFSDVPPVRGYPQQLAQVFMNLLVNASHAIEKDGLIRLSTCRTGDMIEVRVSDNGEGIQPDHLPRIFDPFFTTKPVGKGTGLGMSIAREIIEKHGGSISVTSEVGQGTVFSVVLPAAE